MYGESVLVSEMRAYFDGYARVFDEADWPSFVARYHQPALSVRANGNVRLMPDLGEVESFFRQVWSMWREEGYARFGISELSAHPLGARSVMVSLTWHLLRADASEIRSWRQSYQLLRAGPSWKVLSSTFHA